MKTLERTLNAPDQVDNRIDSHIWGILYNDDNQPVPVAIWFKGDKRDGIAEVFYKCDNAPSDIDNGDALFDLIWEKTGLSRNGDFTTDVKIIRIRDEKAHATLQDALNAQPVEELDDLELILSLAQVMAEKLDGTETKPRFAAIDRWKSRTLRAKTSLIMAQFKKTA